MTMASKDLFKIPSFLSFLDQSERFRLLGAIRFHIEVSDLDIGYVVSSTKPQTERLLHISLSFLDMVEKEIGVE
jgi:hypothetical protein